ncbi:MAG: PEP/pyruvate-binding domain-containing protein [Candidatus Peregrinibacteria bacterium]
MSVLLQEISETQWINRWAGSYTFLSCSYWARQYFFALQEYLGVCFHRTLFIHQKGVSSFFVPEEELELLGKTLAKKTREEDSFLHKNIVAIKENTDLILPFFQNFQKKIPKREEYQAFLPLFNRHLALHVFIKKTVDFLDTETLQEVMPFFIDARIYSEAVYSQSEQCFRALAHHIAKKEGVSDEFLTCLTQKELEEYLESQYLPEERILQARYEHSVLYAQELDIHIMTGEIAKKAEESLFTSNTVSSNVFSGISAYPGKVTGKAIIITNPFEKKLFRDGDILVTGMTRPEFMPLMKKCSAMVTDVGGILCHAAITARELQIPCVVGTGMATKYLKDGDRIEVDGDMGIITKLENTLLMVVPFSGLSISDVSLAGGKGASLAELTKANIPVPDGFVVLTSAFEYFLQENGLASIISEILTHISSQNIHDLENASQEIQKKIFYAEIPGNIQEEIQRSFQSLQTPFVAVRSSATAEDGAENAWAGQLDSYLNTPGKNLIQNVKKCWASLFTPRAIAYRLEKGLLAEKISVAVVVQKMVESEVSGVAFSVHPVTENKNTLLIEAGYGLGEAIVSGQITPESYEVQKNPLQILIKNISLQEKGIFRTTGIANISDPEAQNEWCFIPQEKQKAQKLSDLQILELSALVLSIESHYGFPCDIEWAYEKGKFFIVQSRPITTLTEIVSPLESPRDLVQKYHFEKYTWTNKSFHAVLHTFFPLGIVTQRGIEEFTYRTANTVFFLEGTSLYWYWNDHDLREVRESFFKELQENPHFLEERKQVWKEKLQVFDECRTRIDQTDLSSCSDEELTHIYDDFYAKYTDEYADFMTLGDAISMYADEYFVPRFREILGEQFDELFPKLCNPPYLSFLEEERADRWNMPKQDRDALQKHAEKYFYIQNNYAHAVRLPVEVFEKMREEEGQENEIHPEEAMRIRMNEKMKIIADFSISGWDQTLLTVMDEFFTLQDTRKKYVLISNVYQFQFLREAERRTGIPLDLLCFSAQPEYRQILQKTISLEILKERSKCCAIVHDEHGYTIVTGKTAKNALQFFQKRKDDTESITGMVASKGCVTGRVKKVMKIHHMVNMEKGDVLVASMTRPEMVPAMKLASAIITDEGGVTCHAAIVSREMGIPCIIGTKIATQVLRDGDLVEVDANAGVVRILE